MKRRASRSRSKTRRRSSHDRRRLPEHDGVHHHRRDANNLHRTLSPPRKISHALLRREREASSSVSRKTSVTEPTLSTSSIPSTSFISAYSDSSATGYETDDDEPRRKASAGTSLDELIRNRRSSKRHKEAAFRPEFLLRSLDHTLADEELNLKGFMHIFRSVMEMFGTLGPVFSFVVSEMEDKLGTLEKLRKSEARVHYQTVEGMVRYERKSNLIDGNPESGVRMQQRLHRSLPFIMELLTQIDSVEPNEYLYQFVRDAYNRTLAKYHSWVIRKTITFALRALPKRQDFEQQITNSDQETLATWRHMIPNLERSMNRVHAVSEEIYAKYNVPQLP